MTNKDRILAISKKLDLSHVGSNISCLPVLEEIYAKKKPEDKVVLDCAHSHLAHLVVREQYAGLEDSLAEELIAKDIHCNRAAGCDASGGSLAHTGIAIGYALADPSRMVYSIVSDGSVCEGSFAESLRIAKMLNIKNWEIHANFNSYTAVQKIDVDYFEQWIKGFGYPVIFHRTNNGLPELEGINGHYDKI
jgi:transketolase N-terminal domain/subunit